MGQLRRHDSKTQNKTWEYWYDGCGNLTYKKEYAYTTAEQLGTAVRTIRYTYDGTWKDKLTSYDGKAITSDAIGNMKSYDGWSLSWQHGRELQSISKTGKTLSFKYNADGHRTEKTVNGVKTEYFLEGSRILGELKGGSGEVENRLQWYYYDSTGKRVGLVYRGVMYYYLYNQQGDVVGIVRAGTGQVVATYQYTAWGEVTVTNLSGYTVGDANPFRYRGYYYDAETELYYLNSRYYSPEFGRFINADSQLNPGSGVLGLNLFAYCNNDPVNNTDPSGKFWKKIGNWFRNAWNNVKKWAQSTFGVQTKTSYIHRDEDIVYGYFFSVKYGTTESATRTEGEKKTITAYTSTSNEDSGAGIVSQYGNFSIDASVSTTGMSTKYAYKTSENTSTSLQLKDSIVRKSIVVSNTYTYNGAAIEHYTAVEVNTPELILFLLAPGTVPAVAWAKAVSVF